MFEFYGYCFVIVNGCYFYISGVVYKNFIKEISGFEI